MRTVGTPFPGTLVLLCPEESVGAPEIDVWQPQGVSHAPTPNASILRLRYSLPSVIWLSCMQQIWQPLHRAKGGDSGMGLLTAHRCDKRWETDSKPSSLHRPESNSCSWPRPVTSGLCLGQSGKQGKMVQVWCLKQEEPAGWKFYSH